MMIIQGAQVVQLALLMLNMPQINPMEHLLPGLCGLCDSSFVSAAVNSSNTGRHKSFKRHCFRLDHY